MSPQCRRGRGSPEPVAGQYLEAPKHCRSPRIVRSPSTGIGGAVNGNVTVRGHRRWQHGSTVTTACRQAPPTSSSADPPVIPQRGGVRVTGSDIEVSSRTGPDGSDVQRPEAVEVRATGIRWWRVSGSPRHTGYRLLRAEAGRHRQHAGRRRRRLTARRTLSLAAAKWRQRSLAWRLDCSETAELNGTLAVG